MSRYKVRTYIQVQVQSMLYKQTRVHLSTKLVIIEETVRHTM